MDTDSRVKLAEIGGDIKLIRQSQEQYGKDMERINLAQADFQRTTDQRLHAHSNRIGVLEAKNTLDSGVQQGVGKTLKVMYVLLGGSGGVIAAGVAAIVARARGL